MEDVTRNGDLTLHGLFEAQVALNPDGVAVWCHDSTITYRDLDRGAEELARRLCALGVGREAVVGVCLERSGVIVTALLAILKSGAAYLPLDPSNPPARNGRMLEDVGATLVLGDPHSLDVVSGRPR